MNKQLAALAVAALAAFGPAPAAATSTSSATLSGFTFTLVDLDTTDGYAPSISFLSGLGTGTSQAYSYASNGVGVSANTGYGGGPCSPAASSASVYGTSAAATVGISGGDPTTLSLVAGGSTAGFVPGGWYSSFMASAQAPDPIYLSFSLGANTAVTIGASYALSTMTTSSPTNEYATARVYLAVSGPGADGVTEWQSDIAGQEISVASYWNGTHYAGDSASLAGAMAVTFSNATTGAMEGYMHAYSLANGESMAAVPEPGGWAMLLAGIGMLGVIARRRSRLPS